MFKVIRYKLIKLLGGYTPKEMRRSEEKYKGLLDSITTDNHAKICNIYMCKMLRTLDAYAKSLYGNNSWMDKMFNVIHNNMLRILVRYVNCNSSIIYKLDITLDNIDEFIKIMQDEKLDTNIEEYANTILEND